MRAHAVAGLRPASALLFITGLSVAALALERPKLDVPYVPTPQKVVDRMLEMAKVDGNDYIIDLGSGDGRILVTAARKYGARGFGVDIDPRRVAEARANAEHNGVGDRIDFRVQNLFETDIGKADVLTMYLLSSINLKLRPRLLSELRPGTRIVSHAFDLDEWKPDAQDKVDGRSVYFWMVPARIDGRWELRQGEQRFVLDLDQQFQRFSGSAQANGRTVPISAGTIEGDAVSFVIATADGPQTFRGRVSGDRIKPIASTSGSSASQPDWEAKRQGS